MPRVASFSASDLLLIDSNNKSITVEGDNVRQVALKEHILGPNPAIGMFMEFEDPQFVEIACRAGIDFAVLERQLGLRDPHTLVELIRAADITHTPVLIRVGLEATAGEVARYLSAGAIGIMASFDGTVESAREIVSWTQYPPAGSRTSGYARAGSGYREYRSWNFGAEEVERMARANDDVVLILRVETETAVANLAEVAKVPGVTAVMPSGGNISTNMGIAPGSAEFAEVMTRIDDAVAQNDQCGIVRFIIGSGGVEEAARAGASGFVVGHDTTLVTGFVNSLIEEIGTAAGVRR